MTRPFKEVYNFYISLVVQFIEFWEMFRKNKLPFSALYTFSKRIIAEMKISSDDWKRVLNYYKVYAMTTHLKFSEMEDFPEIGSKLSSICNTTLLLHHDILMFNSLREICIDIIEKSDMDLYQHINNVIEEFLKDRMSKRYYCAEDIDGDPHPDPYGIKDAAEAIRWVSRNESYPNIEDNDNTPFHRLVSEGKCDYIGRARYCAYFMSSIVLDDRELLSNPNWKPTV